MLQKERIFAFMHITFPYFVAIVTPITLIGIFLFFYPILVWKKYSQLIWGFDRSVMFPILAFTIAFLPVVIIFLPIFLPFIDQINIDLLLSILPHAHLMNIIPLAGPDVAIGYFLYAVPTAVVLFVGSMLSLRKNNPWYWLITCYIALMTYQLAVYLLGYFELIKVQG